MGVVKIDVSNPEELVSKGAAVFEPGLYEFQIMNKLREVKCKAPSENNMVKVHLKCVSEGSEMGKTLWDQIVLAETSKWKFFQFCASCGVDLRETGGLIDLQELDGATLNAEVDGDEYNDSPRSKVKAYRFEGDRN